MPALGAVPVHVAVAWILRSRRLPSTRSPLPPGLDGLSPASSARAPAR